MLTLFQVDAFTQHVFGGNPAAVIVLDEWPNDSLLQAIAEENNLAETAYLVATGSAWELRWFTPSAEVALCGHATLAAAHVLLTHLGCQLDTLEFHTRQSGTLQVSRHASGGLAMSFPAVKLEVANTKLAAVSNALGQTPTELWLGQYSPSQYDFVAVFDNEDRVAQLTPLFSEFSTLDSRGVIATARGDKADFVSRYFAPNFGIDEDPVTGSAHCLLTPYWSNILQSATMHAQQISQRGGELRVELDGERVVLIGHAVDYMKGELMSLL